jgi:hypothetical protein
MSEDRLELLHHLSQSFLACETVQFSVSFVYGSLDDLLTEVEFDQKLFSGESSFFFCFPKKPKKETDHVRGIMI